MFMGELNSHFNNFCRTTIFQNKFQLQLDLTQKLIAYAVTSKPFATFRLRGHYR